MTARAPFLHLSVDDVFDGLIDASDRGSPLAADPMVAALDGLNAEFGVSVDLYLFCEGRRRGVRRQLEELAPALAHELRARPWLRLGPHAFDVETPPHGQAGAELEITLDRSFRVIERWVGRERTSRWVRLHQFSECFEAAPLLRSRGVDTLLTTDKPAVAYRLPPAARATLKEKGRVRYEGIDFARSHLRIEHLSADGGRVEALDRTIRDIVDAHGFLTVFTHEVCFADPWTRQTLRRVLGACCALGLASA